VTESSAVLSFDLAEATKHLAERDVCLKRLSKKRSLFKSNVGDAQSPYEALLESIATIISASRRHHASPHQDLSSTAGSHPQEMLSCESPSFAKPASPAQKSSP